MTTNTNLRYTIEFFSPATAEDGDDDAAFTGTSYVLANLYDDLAAYLGVLAVAATYIDGEGDDMRYNVTSVAFPAVSLGVVYVSTNEVFNA